MADEIGLVCCSDPYRRELNAKITSVNGRKTGEVGEINLERHNLGGGKERIEIYLL